MKVTIEGVNAIMEMRERLEGVEWERVTVKETKRRNGATVTEVRIDNGTKRDTRITSGNYSTITIQDEETGRYLLKYSR